MPPINLQDAIDRGDLTLSTDSIHVLRQLLVTAKRWQKKNYWKLNA